MANGGVDLDELLAARERLNAERNRSAGRGSAAATPSGPADELTLPRLIGLWLLVTGLVIVKIIALALEALVEVMEWLRRENESRRTRRRRRR